MRITFKTPDAVDMAVEEAVEAEAPDERDALADEYRAALQKWVKYGEYITVEFDLKAGTAKVVEAE